MRRLCWSCFPPWEAQGRGAAGPCWRGRARLWSRQQSVRAGRSVSTAPRRGALCSPAALCLRFAGRCAVSC